MDNIFEKATRQKIRFDARKGDLSVEDLWELSLNDLDIIAKALNRKIREDEEESFIGKKSRTKTELALKLLKLDVVKSVIATKLEEEEKAKTRATNKAQAEFLQELVQKKKLNALEAMPLEEIEKQLASLKEEED